MVKFVKEIAVFLKSSTSAIKKYNHLAVNFLKGKKNDIKSTTSTSIQLVPSVVKKPSVLWRWLFTSYWFYFSVILLILLMNTVVSAAIDKSLSIIYPPVKTERFFGLVVQQQDDPRIAWQRKFIRGVLWAGAIGLNGYVLLLCLPRVVRTTTRKAHDKEVMADTMVTEKPSESILLYNKALKLAVDQSHESSLKNKIDMLDNGFLSGKIERPSSAPPTTPGSNGTGTIVIPINESSPDSNQEGGIGPDGRYRIDRKLGQGAMGCVYLGKDQLLFREVALKKLSAGQHHDENLLPRFQQEARALARLSHPNIVQIYDFIQEEDEYWIAMEYVEGSDLETLFSKNGRFEVVDALRICTLISDAMNYAHARGVVHRDFKPSNVLVTNTGDPKVMDFGLAKLTQSSIATVEGSLLGSPAYMSPEQAMGKPADERSDIYALGVTLFQLLTGRLPFEGDLKSVITQKIAKNRPSLKLIDDHVPDDLKELVGNMMAYEPHERPVSMQEIGVRLKIITDAVS
jgi:serine/threonine protein kinase